MLLGDSLRPSDHRPEREPEPRHVPSRNAVTSRAHLTLLYVAKAACVTSSGVIPKHWPMEPCSAPNK
jgi:hypothetical protein